MRTYKAIYMNETESKLILLINQLPKEKRDVFHLSVKLNKSFSATYNYLRLLLAAGHIKRSKVGKKQYFFVSSFETVKMAEKRLSNGEGTGTS